MTLCSRRIALLALVSQAAALAPPTPRARPCARCRRVRLRSEPGDAPAEAAAPVEDVPIATTEPEPAAPQLTERQKEIARLRAAEKFLEKDTGKYMCKVCEYQYDPEEGAKGVAAATPFEDIQSNWRCPRCRASKDSFEPVTITIAGFAENQNYGFGGNSMTEGDKNLAIFGGLGFFFVLLLSGYLMT